MSNLDQYSGFDKAAILLQILGEPLALTLFNSIAEPELLKLRVRSKELDNTPMDFKKAILDEYYFKIMSDRYRDKKEDNDVFRFIKNLNDEQVYYLLSKEEIAVIALALEQLKPEKQMLFLNKLEPEKRNKIVIKIGSLDDIPLEAVVQIAKDLEQKAAFIPGPKEFSRGGGKSIANILSNMSEDEASQYISQLQTENPDLYNEVKNFYISFTDLVETLPESMSANFWSNPDIDVDILAKALKGFEKDATDKIVNYLPGKKQAMFTPIDKPVAKREVDLARTNILDIAKEKVKSGEWNLEDIFGGGEFIE